MKNKTIFCSNCVDDDLIQEVREEMKHNDRVDVCFNVIGRTLHQMLSYQLAEKLPEYNFDIEYNYKCTITKKDSEEL